MTVTPAIEGLKLCAISKNAPAAPDMNTGVP